VADIPGLIEGASEGRELGDRFLGHVERCSVLIHLVDATAEDPAEDWRVILRELELYGEGLIARPRITVLNKIDALDAEERAAAQEALEQATGGPVLPMSAATGEGVREVLRAARRVIEAARVQEAPAQEDAPWSP